MFEFSGWHRLLGEGQGIKLDEYATILLELFDFWKIFNSLVFLPISIHILKCVLELL